MDRQTQGTGRCWRTRQNPFVEDWDAIIQKILGKLSQCNVILYAAPGKEAFYNTFGFSKMKTGVAMFKKATAMRERGFTE